MKIKIRRILAVLVALSIAGGIVWALSFAGKKTEGPIETALVKASDAIEAVENTVIVEQRTEKRSDKLAWLNVYKTNKNALRHPKEILLGAFDNNAVESFESIINLEDTLHTTFPLIQVYSAWGSKEDEVFPKMKVKAIKELGSIPVITWEPWLSDFDGNKYPALRPAAERDKNGLVDVATGLYDDYIKSWAASAAATKQLIFLRVGHEMNDPYRYPWGPQNNSPQDFVNAWRHIHDIFKSAGANNIIWVWCPHPAYGWYNAYYPGDAYVDYVGVGILNYGTVATWSQWWGFKDIFGNHYDSLAVFKKPIMITEFASLAVGGKRSQWYDDALMQLPQKYPLVKSVLFFHFSNDNTTTQQTLDWYVIDDKQTVGAIRKSITAWPDSLKGK
jgi:hypothetical protein